MQCCVNTEIAHPSSPGSRMREACRGAPQPARSVTIPELRIHMPCESVRAAANHPPQGGVATSTTAAIDRDARQRLDAIFAFIGAAVEDTGCALPLTDALVRDAAHRLADFGSFMARHGLGTLSDPTAQAGPLYLRSLRERASAADCYAAASVLHLVYGHWPWVPTALRRMDQTVIA